MNHICEGRQCVNKIASGRLCRDCLETRFNGDVYLIQKEKKEGLRYCKKCEQMTNHKLNIDNRWQCLKCILNNVPNMLK